MVVLDERRGEGGGEFKDGLIDGALRAVGLMVRSKSLTG
jgi:hypothetical protein